MPTMDAEALNTETEGLAALRRTLGGVDELSPLPGDARPDMYRPRRPRLVPPEPANDAARLSA